MFIKGLHHVAIICSDYQRSKDFYTRILGFPIIGEVFRPQRQSYKLNLAVSDHSEIELFSFPNPPARPSYPEAQGLRHLAFSVEDIDLAVEHLKSLGVSLEPIRVDEQTSKKFTFFCDPDGLPLEIYELQSEL